MQYKQIKIMLYCLFITMPAVENILSASTDIGGIHKYRLAKIATWEKCPPLTLKSASKADILAITNAHKQSTVTFEVFVLWLCNQRYYTCDVIGIYVPSGCLKHWLIHHSMACTVIYSSHDSSIIKYGRPCLDCGSVEKTHQTSTEALLSIYCIHLHFSIIYHICINVVILQQEC